MQWWLQKKSQLFWPVFSASKSKWAHSEPGTKNAPEKAEEKLWVSKKEVMLQKWKTKECLLSKRNQAWETSDRAQKTTGGSSQ